MYGTLVGHNVVAPYHDNDFEVFIDVSGTGEYYKEYEMNALNATYDINWGVRRSMLHAGRSTRAAPRGPLHEGRSTGGSKIFFILICTQY